MSDKQFDLFLQNSLPELPPEDVAGKVNPWRKFIFYIIIGLIFNTDITWIPYVSFIFPMIGNILLVFGFQALREENRYFKLGWIFSIIAYIIFPILRMYSCTYVLGKTPIIMIIGLVMLIVATYSMFRCLALGIGRIQEECGGKPNDRLQRIVLACSSVLVFLNIMSDNLLWGGHFTIAVYFVLIVCVIRLMNEIKNVGYSIRIAPVMISNKKLVIITLVLIGIGFLLGKLL